MKNAWPNAVSLSKVLCLAVLLVPQLSWARSQRAFRAFNEGVKFFNEHQYNEAVSRFDEAISEDASFAESYYARGACKYYLKSLDGALVDLNDALRLDPDQIDARALRGAVQYESDHWDAALTDFNAVLKEKPNDAQSLLGRAVIRLKRSDREGAARDFRGFLRIRPNDPLAPQVREVLASLKRAPAEAAAERPAPAEPSSVSAPGRPMSAADLQRMADDLLNHPLAENYGRQVLRGDKTQAVGDIHSDPVVPAESKHAPTGVEIVDPQ